MIVFQSLSLCLSYLASQAFLFVKFLVEQAVVALQTLKQRTGAHGAAVFLLAPTVGSESYEKIN
jgi:hypothetical protein